MNPSTNDLDLLLDAVGHRSRHADATRPPPDAFVRAVAGRRRARRTILAASLALPLLGLAAFLADRPVPGSRFQPLGEPTFVGAPTAGRLRAINADRDVDHIILPPPTSEDASGADVRKELPRGVQPHRP